MSREMRKVPKDWVHPVKTNGRHKALFDGAGYERLVAAWDKERAKYPDKSEDEFDSWDGPRPDAEDYMLVGVPPEERTHYQMYQTTSEGTPISPIMESPEELARWCADEGLNAFGGMTEGYEWWLRVCKGRAGFGMTLNHATGETKPV